MQITMNVDRGTTAISPDFYETNEVLPPNITADEIEAGIGDGTYTLKDLHAYTFLGYLKKGYSSPKLLELAFTIENNRLKFTIPAEETQQWDNKPHDLLFDIKRTEIATGNVDIWVKGKIEVLPVVTDGV